MRFALLIIAAVIAVFAGIAAMQLSTPAPGANTTAAAANTGGPAVTTVDVLVARNAIPAGTIITPDMVDKQPWPEHLVLAGFITGSGPNANIIGKMTRSGFQAREPFIATKLAAGGDSGFLAAALPTGMRAVTISTDAVTGVAGFVFPGDHVDIVFTHNVPQDAAAAEGASGKGGGSGKPGFAEVLAANVPVLAINLREVAEAPAAGGAPAAPNAMVSTTPSSMTLQVTDIQAEKIRLAEKVGGLSVALRSVNDRDNNGVTPPTDLMSLTQVSEEAAPAQADTLRVVKGGDFGGSGGR